MSEMKLFVWPTVKALAQYDDGIAFAFALAPNKKDAVDAVLKKFKRESRYWQMDYVDLAKELVETEPLVVESTEGFWRYGSD